MNLTYRADIDGLRAIAVIMVVIFHAFPSRLGGGFIGVDIFFVISGFLITNILISSLNERKFDLINFYCRRIQRIFPALIVVLVACFTFGWFNLLADEYKQLGKHIGGGASFSSNFILLSEFDALIMKFVYIDNSLFAGMRHLLNKI
jgi:peptidoglycan/LPS O-acetylase OafA/YrhL